jgi:hypothetical protein
MTQENSGSERDPDSAGEPAIEPAPEVADPAGLLNEMRRLRRTARSARHAYWFPLVLFGLLTCAAVPLYLLATQGGSGISALGGPSPDLTVLGGSQIFRSGSFLGYYWLVALLGGLALTLLWYRRHARRIGLKTPARGYLITTSVLTGLAFFLPVIAQIPGLRFLWVLLPGDLTLRGTVPFLIIAAGLCVLAWAERSRALGVVAAVYTGTALVASLYDLENVLFRLGWNPSRGQLQLTSLPNVLLPALVLLVAGGVAFLVQRDQRSAA